MKPDAQSPFNPTLLNDESANRFRNQVTGIGSTRCASNGTSARPSQDVIHDAPLPQLPENLACFQPLLDRMLAKQPDARFASATEFRDALAAA